MTEIGVVGKAVDWCLLGSQIGTMIDGPQVWTHVCASAAAPLRRIQISTPRRALVVDDQRSNIEVLAMLLAQQGFTTAAVESLRQVGAALAELDRLDVVFLDLGFPNGSGLELIKDLRLRPLLKEVPIVAYTVHTGEVKAVREAGFDGLLSKPLDGIRFPDQLRRILNHEAVWE